VNVTPEAKADLVATIARTFAYRQRHHIEHTGHTARRLMEAVSDLLGKRVQVIEAPQYDAGLRAARYDPRRLGSE